MVGPRVRTVAAFPARPSWEFFLGGYAPQTPRGCLTPTALPPGQGAAGFDLIFEQAPNRAWEGRSQIGDSLVQKNEVESESRRPNGMRAGSPSWKMGASCSSFWPTSSMEREGSRRISVRARGRCQGRGVAGACTGASSREGGSAVLAWGGGVSALGGPPARPRMFLVTGAHPPERLAAPERGETPLDSPHGYPLGSSCLGAAAAEPLLPGEMPSP